MSVPMRPPHLAASNRTARRFAGVARAAGWRFLLAVILVLPAHRSLRAQEKKDPPRTFTNGIGMKFVWIAPGSFVMGSPDEEKHRRVVETRHKVTLTKGFYMGTCLVTQEQWQDVMGNNPSHFTGEKNLPVDTVSWDDCQAFIKKLQEKENDGRVYRLPTEAEWEYACRAGTAGAFHFGDTISTDRATMTAVSPMAACEGHSSREDHAGRRIPSQRMGIARHAR